MRKLILASTSPYRAGLLERLGIPFTAAPPRYEKQIDQSLSPADLVIQLALGKAASLVSEYPDGIIIGSDQALVSQGRIIGKPGSPERAREQLREMSGGVHTFYTGLAVIDAANDLTLTRLRPLHRYPPRPYRDRNQRLRRQGKSCGLRRFIQDRRAGNRPHGKDGRGRLHRPHRPPPN
jgi:MAF protein